MKTLILNGSLRKAGDTVNIGQLSRTLKRNILVKLQESSRKKYTNKSFNL